MRLTYTEVSAASEAGRVELGPVGGDAERASLALRRAFPSAVCTRDAHKVKSASEPLDSRSYTIVVCDNRRGDWMGGAHGSLSLGGGWV